MAGDHFATVESIAKRAVAIHDAGGFGTAAKNKSLAGQDNREVFVWSRMARMFFQPIDARDLDCLRSPTTIVDWTSAESPVNTSRLAPSPFLDTFIVSDTLLRCTS